MTDYLEAILLVEKGIGDVSVIPLDREVYVLGKSPAADIALDNPYVSRRHAQIAREGGRFRIAFRSNRAGNNFDIYVMNADGTNPRNLTNSPASDFRPAWSPGGKSVAFMSNRGGNFDIYVMNADGTNQRRLTNNTAEDYDPAWAP